MSNRILYIDNQPINIQLVRRMAKAMNCELIEVLDGFGGLNAAGSQHPDLILMDINIPDVDVYELIHKLKTNPALREVPVVALTTENINYRNWIERGFDGYLNKPISTFELMRTILHFLDLIPTSEHITQQTMPAVHEVLKQ